MATYNPLKKAPNVSEYIANLNAIPSTQDASPQQQDGYGLEDDLALFTNTIFNFEPGEILDQPPLDYDPLQGDRVRRENAAAKNINGEDSNMNFATGKTLSFISIHSVRHILPSSLYSLLTLRRWAPRI